MYYHLIELILISQDQNTIIISGPSLAVFGSIGDKYLGWCDQ